MMSVGEPVRSEGDLLGTTCARGPVLLRVSGGAMAELGSLRESMVKKS